ncbi:MAG: helix-turn-helix transcriptional regulator [Verrucomicrobia bacterium]|nr:helix-turn-helix transcriptional regulator [Verrucomicrobiota bacterium]MCH8511405.1 helix-turn-helix transcriptional regulator [Kiritimatiellia bacterium]
MSGKEVDCQVELTLKLIGGRWKVLIIQQLLQGTKRFNALQRSLSTISHKSLTQQLRELERDGLVSRKVYPQVPPKVEYRLTELGKSLAPILYAMHDWANEHKGKIRS